MVMLKGLGSLLRRLIQQDCARHCYLKSEGGFMSSLLIKDPLFSKGFHNSTHPSPSLPIQNTFFVGKVVPKVDICNGFRIKGGGVGLTLKGCFEFESHKKKGDADSRSIMHNPLTIVLSQQFKLHRVDVEIEDKKDAGSVNGSRWSNHSGFLRQNSPEKIVVAVDIDEVLGNFVSALNRFIADRYSSNHSVSEYHVYEFFKIWGCSRNEADLRVHEFFKTPYFKKGIHPLPGAQRVLHKLARHCKFSVVTSRQNAIKDHTIEWIEKHYPGLFEEIHFGNHFALNGESRPKSEICRSLGAKVLIDDNPRYAIECADVGIKVLLFDYENSYPWCKTESIDKHPLVTKVRNWEEVEQQLVSLVAA
ncbi:hypothetical protein NL676_035986 [Syzygium grande]|nr:hypothetical protein NL676_035986 [Syzygium grande]